MNARKRTVAVSMSVSTPSGATAVSAGVALFCMRTNTTVKKVFHLKFVSLIGEHLFLFLNYQGTNEGQ